MTDPYVMEVLRMEAQFDSILKRIEDKADSAARIADAREAKEVFDWKEYEHNRIEDWKLLEGVVIDEWRQRESNEMEEWKGREFILYTELSTRHELYRILDLRTRGPLQFEIDQLKRRVDKTYKRMVERADCWYHAMKVDQANGTGPSSSKNAEADKENEVRKPVSHKTRRIELWSERRRLEEVVKRKQVDSMLQKGPLIVEIEEREKALKERAEAEYIAALEEKERKEQQKREAEQRERERVKEAGEMMAYLTSDKLRSRRRSDHSMEAFFQAQLNKPVLKSQDVLNSHIDKNRLSLELRIALLGALQYLNDFDICRTISCVSREWRQMLNDDRLLAARRANVMEILKDFAGMNFVRIPAGIYPIGKPNGVSAKEVIAQGRVPDTAEYFTLEQEYKLPRDLFMSEDVITIATWKKIEKLFPHLKGIVVPEDYTLCNYNVIHGSDDGKRPFAVVKKDVVEKDPALELPYATAAKIACGLGGTLPTWKQWEAAVRGPDATLYPWGNVIKLDAIESEGLVHVWTAPNPNFGRANKDGMREMAKDMTKTCALMRLQDWGPHTDAKSRLGLGGLCRWGKEWNIVRGETSLFETSPELRSTHCLRSLCDLYSVNDAHRWETPFKEELLASNHRAFSAPMACCLRAPQVFGDGSIPERAAFRLAFMPSGDIQIHAARPTTPGWL